MKREELLQAAKPILFNTDMVRAILDGRKTMTRRVIKPQPKMILCYTFAGCGCEKWGYPDKNAYEYWGDEYKRTVELSQEDEKRMWTPPYHTDDILYVRETWNICNMCSDGNTIVFIYKADKSEKDSAMEVRVSDELYDKYERSMAENNPDWRPSIHMPKEAARIFLKVTDVRVDRLQEITKDQARAEGCDGRCECPSSGTEGNLSCVTRDFSIEKFGTVWNSTIKVSDLERYGWDANPWVWVIEFERVVGE